MKIFKLDINQIDVNIMFFSVDEAVDYNPKELEQFLRSKSIILGIPATKGAKIRLVTHFYIRDKEAEHILAAFKEFFKIK